MLRFKFIFPDYSFTVSAKEVYASVYAKLGDQAAAKEASDWALSKPVGDTYCTEEFKIECHGRK